LECKGYKKNFNKMKRKGTRLPSYRSMVGRRKWLGMVLSLLVKHPILKGCTKMVNSNSQIQGPLDK
jgi:hypothetical protein